MTSGALYTPEQIKALASVSRKPRNKSAHEAAEKLVTTVPAAGLQNAIDALDEDYEFRRYVERTVAGWQAMADKLRKLDRDASSPLPLPQFQLLIDLHATQPSKQSTGALEMILVHNMPQARVCELLDLTASHMSRLKRQFNERRQALLEASLQF
jgi:DNA-directed RNA polymerase specialized sigma subunit